MAAVDRANVGSVDTNILSTSLPSTSGTRPRQTAATKAPAVKPDPSGASTSGTTPPAKAHFLRQRPKVDYKELNTGATKFGRAEFRKRCSKAGASVRKSVAKVRKKERIGRKMHYTKIT